MHYPPVYSNFKVEPMIDIMCEFGVRRCYYGHVHGKSIPYAYNGMYRGVDFRLVSADFLGFMPYRLA